MKKNKLLRRISVGVAAAALVATSAVSVAFANYQTTTTGEKTVDIASWSFQINSNEANATQFDLTLTPYTYDNVVADQVAPGTKGQFKIKADNKSDVAAEYSIDFTVTNKPQNLHFYYDQDCTKAITDSDNITGTNGDNGGTYSYSFGGENNSFTGKLDKTNGTETVTIYWAWAYSTSDESNVVEPDQATISTGSYQMKVKVEIDGWQAKPTNEVSPS